MWPFSSFLFLFFFFLFLLLLFCCCFSFAWPLSPWSADGSPMFFLALSSDFAMAYNYTHIRTDIHVRCRSCTHARCGRSVHLLCVTGVRLAQSLGWVKAHLLSAQHGARNRDVLIPIYTSVHGSLTPVH